MQELVDNIIYCEFEELEDVVFLYNQRFGLCITFNNVKYEFLLNLKENCDKLIVFGSGAYSMSKPRERFGPKFDRWSWDFEYSTIHYNDPTLYLSKDMKAGWGVGKTDDWYLGNIAKIISIISKKINVFNKNILFFGSSQGGFTAIVLSILIKESKALADIPQFDLFTYWSFHWENLKKYSFLENDDSIIFEKYGYRTNIIELIKKEKYIPNIVLILDFSVLFDLESQYIPFFKKIAKLPFNYHDFIKIMIGNKNQGHNPLFKKYIVPIIYHILEDNLNDFLPDHENITKENWDNMLLNDNEQFELFDNQLWECDKNVKSKIDNEIICFYHECAQEFRGITLPFQLPKNFTIKFKLKYSIFTSLFIDSKLFVTFRNSPLNYDLPLSSNEWHDIEIIRDNGQIVVKADGEGIKVNESNGSFFSIKVYGSNNYVAIKRVYIKQQHEF